MDVYNNVSNDLFSSEYTTNSFFFLIQNIIFFFGNRGGGGLFSSNTSVKFGHEPFFSFFFFFFIEKSVLSLYQSVSSRLACCHGDLKLYVYITERGGLYKS